MISPSLQSLCKCPINRDNQPSQGNDEEERLRTLQMELYNVLVDPSNVSIIVISRPSHHATSTG
jgi:hypothetical protein